MLTTHSHGLLYSLKRFIYSIAGYFHRCKISWKICVCFRRNFAVSVFVLAGCCNWPSLHVSRLSASHRSRNFWETLTRLSMSLWRGIPLPRKVAQLCILVGLIAFHLHQQKMTKLISSFALCTYTRRVNSPSCSRAIAKIHQGLFHALEITKGNLQVQSSLVEILQCLFSL